MLLPSIRPSRKKKFLKKWQSSLPFLRQVMIPTTLIVIFLELCEIWIAKKVNLWVRVARNRNTLIMNHKHDYVFTILLFFKTFPRLNRFLFPNHFTYFCQSPEIKDLKRFFSACSLCHVFQQNQFFFSLYVYCLKLINFSVN